MYVSPEVKGDQLQKQGLDFQQGVLRIFYINGQA